MALVSQDVPYVSRVPARERVTLPRRRAAFCRVGFRRVSGVSAVQAEPPGPHKIIISTPTGHHYLSSAPDPP